MLSDRFLRTLRVTKEKFIAAGDGLYVRVTPKGRRTFVFRTQVGGKSRWKVLGHYPHMSILEARNQAERAAQQGFLTFTVRQAYTEYRVYLKETYDSWEEIDRRLEKDILPELGPRPLDQVTKRECVDLLLKIVKRGARVAANRTMADLKHFFEYCVDRGWIQGDPAAGIKRKTIGGREKPRERALSWEELKIFLQHKYTWDPRTTLALAIVLYTGQRSGEVIGYDECERQGCWWHIPAERTKPRRLQKVYLSPQARHLLKLAVQQWGKRPFMFDHRRLDKALSRLLARTFPNLEPFTPHDLRRTMSTRLADLGVAPHVIEKMLNHQMEGAMAVYNRAEYLPERKAAWRLWGATLAQLRRRKRADSTHNPATPDRLRDSRGIHPGNATRGGVQSPVHQ